MSNEGDQTVFYNTVTDTKDSSNDVLFSDKNYTFITDTTSSNGSFQSGQIAFDLSTLSSQSQWVSLSEAVIEFPVKVSANVTTAGAAGGGVTMTSLATTLKNGFHHFIDGCQLQINGQGIQSMQPYENVAATFRILSEWSQDELVKYGRTCGVILDDCTNDTIATPAVGVGLNNAANATVTSTILGFNAYESTLIKNKALPARLSLLSDQTAATSLQSVVLGNAASKIAGRHNLATATIPAGNTGFCYTACYLATVRLKDICDIGEFPLCKNLKGFLYISFNSSQTTISGTTSAPSAVTIQPLTGRTNPIMINNVGLSLGTVSSTVVVTATVNSDNTGATGAGPLISNARMFVPYYVSNPKADMALSIPNKFFTTKEKIVVPFVANAGQPANITLTSGVSNPTGLLILPMWQRLGLNANLDNPENSPYDSVPGTSGPFATLANLQVYVANKPIYQTPVQYDFEQWYAENSKTGLADGIIDQQASGLLTQQLFEQNHKFYYVDLSRRVPSEDGASKSIQVSFTNPSQAYGMKCIAVVFYQKKWTINTMTSQITSAV